MASERQIAANRRNAQKSTGPRTEQGKLRSRRNAFRHGLTAETVIRFIENTDDYTAFQKRIVADYEPQTAIEHHLVVRLTSLLWRLRRALAIECGLFQIQEKTIRDRQLIDQNEQLNDPLTVFRKLLRPDASGELPENLTGSPDVTHSQQDPSLLNLDLASCFLRLADLKNGPLGLISRYETRLWRQVVQTLVILDSTHRHSWTPRPSTYMSRFR